MGRSDVSSTNVLRRGDSACTSTLSIELKQTNKQTNKTKNKHYEQVFCVGGKKKGYIKHECVKTRVQCVHAQAHYQLKKKTNKKQAHATII